MAYKLNISKAGYDADDSDPRNLVFSSDFNAHKIYLSGSTNLSYSGGGSTSTLDIVTHSMGYHPAYMAFIETPANSGKMYGWSRKPDSASPGPGINSGWWDVFSTTSKLQVDLSGANGTYPCSYIVFADNSKDNSVSRSYSGSYGLKIAKSGKAATSTNLKDFTFHSEYPPLSEITAVTLSTSGFIDTDQVAHGLGYRPAFSASADIDGLYKEVPWYTYATFGYEVYVDDTYVYARSYAIASTDATYTVRLFNHEI